MPEQRELLLVTSRSFDLLRLVNERIIVKALIEPGFESVSRHRASFPRYNGRVPAIEMSEHQRKRLKFARI